MLGRFIIFCLLGLFSITTAFSHDHSIECLRTNKDHSIVEETEEKIYLNFDRLVFDRSGIFLENDLGELFPIKDLFYRQGMYCISKPTRWICSSCGREYSSQRSICLAEKYDGTTCFGSVSERYDCDR